MEMLDAIALAAGLAWASGLRLYAVVFVTGLLAKFGFLHLPPGLEVLSHPWVMVVSGLLFFVEFFVDKIPAIDTVWDAVHTFIRIPAGAALAAASLGAADPAVTTAAVLLGGTLAAGTHFAKAGTRLAINTSPEPFTNIAASLAEESLVFAGLYALFTHPVVFLALLAVFVVVAVWLVARFWRLLRTLFRRRAA